MLQQLQRDASRSNQSLAQELGISAPTCLRRVKRLQELGLIEKQIAIVNPERLASTLGHGLQAIVEVTLDRQDSTSLLLFEQKAIASSAVQQCWRVSPGPDFVLVIAARDMPSYLALSEKLFARDANVRNVRSFFSLKRAKFSAELPVEPQLGSSGS